MLDTFSCWIDRSKRQKNYNYDNLKITKNSFTHFLCQFFVVVVNCSCWSNKLFFAMFSFARTGSCPLCPAWPHCPTFPYTFFDK